MISSSVGRRGVNKPDDVRKVQGLLNDNGVSPRLKADGLSGPRTEAAIEWFQSRIVRLASPDARVDPGGRTWRSLVKRDGRRPEKAAPKPRSPHPEERQEFRKERTKFVDPRVKETAVTSRIIDSLMPFFRGTDVRVISAWLSDGDLFWKVNYHWEYLLWMVEHAEGLSVAPEAKTSLGNIRSMLLAVAPEPSSGYRTSSKIGLPEDKTSVEAMTKRHSVMAQQKREFAGLTRKFELAAKSTRPLEAFHLAAAPVAHPGKTKHSTGYAIDMKGSPSVIKSKCKGLGATLVFNEKSHVHVEFKNGVQGGA